MKLKTILLVAFVPTTTVFAIFCGASVFSDKGEQFIAPGNHTIELDAGSYALWHNYMTVHEGVTYSKLESLPDGAVIRMYLDEQEFPFTSRLGQSSKVGNEGRAGLGLFDVLERGTCRIEVSGFEEPHVVSVSKPPLLNRPVALTLVVIFVASVLFAFVAYWLRALGERVRRTEDV